MSTSVFGGHYLHGLSSQFTDDFARGLLIVTQQYKSFVAHFEVDDKDTNGLLSALITEDPKAPVVRLVTVGMPVSKLPTALRERYIPEVEVIEVCGDTDCGKFHIRNGRVARIKYECYTG